MLKKLFKTNQIQETDMTETHETHADKARAKVRETVKMIAEAESDLERNSIDYAEALESGNKDRCLALLEQEDAVRRNLRMHSDFLPIHEAEIEQAVKLDAAPEIVAQCIEAQKLCDVEAQLIDAYVLACHEFKNATEALVQQSAKTNQTMIILNQDIKRVGSTPRPAVSRAAFKKPMYVFEVARQLFPHFGEGSISSVEERRP